MLKFAKYGAIKRNQYDAFTFYRFYFILSYKYPIKFSYKSAINILSDAEKWILDEITPINVL